MKKPARKLLIRKLDKKFSEIIRSRGVCAKCRKGADQVTLHCAHIFSRTRSVVRWDFDNAMPLCYHCHFWWAHKNPIEFADFAKSYLGAYKFNQLKMRSRAIKKWTIEELKGLLVSLTAKELDRGA